MSSAVATVRYQRPWLPPAERVLEYYRLAEEARYFSNGGPCVRELETRLGARLGGVECVTVANCTLAIVIALRALCDPRRRLIATPAYSFTATACAVEAARVRRLLAEDTSVPDQLSHELRACVALAERNGITVQFAERGVRPAMPKAVRRALTEPAVAALATAASTARVTVVGAHDEVTVSVVADVQAEHVPPATDPAIMMSTVETGDKLWVKTTWRRT